MSERPVLAFDLGGTRLKGGIVHSRGVRRMKIVDVAEDSGQAALEALAELGRDLKENEDPAGAGLCVPGLVGDDGRIISLPGKFPGIVGVDLKGFVRTELGLEVTVTNDAIAYGVGEATEGAGARFDRVVVVTIGTGVGVTVVDHGRPLGSGSLGGGILGGFIPIAETSAEPDTSGERGTVEAFCRAVRITDEANARGGTFASPADVYKAYRAGDTAAQEGVAAYRGHLARALIALANAHAPAAIVVGGGPATPSAPILEGLEANVNDHLWPGYEVRVLPAALGDEAALVGIATLRRSS